MRRVLLLLAVLLCFAGKAKAQAEIPHFASDPATCDNTRGLLYFNTTSNVVKSCTSLNTWTSVGGITSVSALPATCTPGTTQPVQLTANITVGNPSIPFGQGTVFYCDSTNHWSPVSQGGGLAPVLGFYLGPQCPPSNQGYCFNSPGNAQISQLCTYTAGSAIVTCQTAMMHNSAAVVSNVATYTTVLGDYANGNAGGGGNVPSSWAIGNSITISVFTGADAFFNQTCTISAIGTQSVSCPLVHANASSGAGSFGNVLNTSAGPFSAADAGTGNPYGAKRIWGYGSCNAFTNLAANNRNNPITTSTALTIASFQSSLQVTMSGNAANSSTTAGQGCVIWGNPDDAGALAMDTAMMSSAQCPRPHLPAAFYMFTTPHFFTNSAFGCGFLPSLWNGPLATAAGGNMEYAGGFELEGRGPGATTIFLPPAFPETGNCNHGKSVNACFVVPVEGRWANIQLSGGGNYSSPNFVSGNILLEVAGPGSLDYVTCTNFGGGTTGTFGFVGLVFAQFQQTIVSACGDSNYGSTYSAVTGFRVESDNCYSYCWYISPNFNIVNNNGLIDKYNLILYDPFFQLGPIGVLNNVVRDAVGSPSGGQGIKLYHAKFSNFNNSTNGNVAYLCAVAGCLLDMEDTYMDMTANGTATTTGDFAIFCANVTCTVVVKNSLIKGSTSGGSAYRDGNASSVLFDMGGNTWGGGVPFTVLGKVIADGHSLKGTCTGTATASSTLGLYNTGPNVTATTCTSTNIGSGIPIPGARTAQNLVVTSTAAGVNAASGVVTVLKNGVATTITCTVGTGTSCTDGTHSVAFTDGDLISIQFTSQAAETLAGVKAFVEWN